MAETKINTIGIDHNLDRARIRKLLVIGMIGSILTGIGDFLIGFGEEIGTSGFAESLMANAINMSDAQLICGGLLGAFGLLLEGLAGFAVYRLLADSSLKYAHIYRAGIIGYIWLAPIGCHMNVGLMNIVYKREFHCKGEFKGIHNGRPNDEDLKAAAAFAENIVKLN